MEFYDAISLIIRTQAIFLMLVVILKLWYNDRTQAKTKIALTFERFMKYSLFKRALFFVMLTFLFGTLADIVRMRAGPNATVEVFGYLSLFGLISFAYLLFKISSYTYEPEVKSHFWASFMRSSDVVVPMVGGALTAILVFFVPFGQASATGMVVSDVSDRSTLIEFVLLLLSLGSVALIVMRTIRK